VSLDAPPALPSAFTRDGLASAGFTGWRTWEHLRSTDLQEVPATPAAYVVLRPQLERPTFLVESPAGHFKNLDPTVSIDELDANWVDGAGVVYIGKANNARRRLKQFAFFGAGKPIGHRGGRLIWQLPDVDELLVAWHSIGWDESARGYEQRLLSDFKRAVGERPFANLRD
jgi:hypothetical protein